MNGELPAVQSGFRKGRGTRDQIAKSVGSSKRQESYRQTSASAFLTRPKPLTAWITITCGKFFKRWDYQMTWPASWEICMQVRKQQLEPDIEQWTGSKLGNSKYIKTVYCHPIVTCLFNLYAEYMRNARLDETQAGIKIGGRNINNLRYADDS